LETLDLSAAVLEIGGHRLSAVGLQDIRLILAKRKTTNGTAKILKSILALKLEFLYSIGLRAEVAQLVEHNLAKVGVAGSSPVFRSIV
jgi:hypothetical protein